MLQYPVDTNSEVAMWEAKVNRVVAILSAYRGPKSPEASYFRDELVAGLGMRDRQAAEERCKSLMMGARNAGLDIDK